MFIQNFKILSTVATLSAAMALTGCGTQNGNNNAVKKGALGAAAGAIAGAVIGNNAGDGDAQSGALIGAVIGGAGGAYAGCREDGGCGSQSGQSYQRYDEYGRPIVGQQPPVQQINKRQYFDQRTGRYYYYDPATRQEFYENGERKYN